MLQERYVRRIIDCYGYNCIELKACFRNRFRRLFAASKKKAQKETEYNGENEMNATLHGQPPFVVLLYRIGERAVKGTYYGTLISNILHNAQIDLQTQL